MTPTLERTLQDIEGMEGWLTEAQARRLWQRARALEPPARVVEIGSYRGRSTVVLARASAAGVAVTAIDPHAGNDRGPRQIRGTAREGETDHEAFRANLARAGVVESVRHVRLPSRRALGEVEGEVDLLYVDGAHRYVPARDDLARWGARVRPGGTMLVHDAFSSVGVTLALARLLLLSGSFAYEGRVGSLAEYRRSDPRGRDRIRSFARQAAEAPWLARNLLVKMALVAGLTGVARALGHRHGPWPY